MSMIRLIALALPMTILMACGGGGGGGTAAAPTTMNPPTNMPDPMTPPTNTPDPNTPPPPINPDTLPTLKVTDDPMTPPPVTLPGYAITNLEAARMAAGGTAPTTNMTEMEIVDGIQTRATAADYFEFSDFDAMAEADTVSVYGDVDDDFHFAIVPDIGIFAFSRVDIEDLSLVDDTSLTGFLSNTELVMENKGVTVIQSQSAAGQGDTRLGFQSYGGWLDGSVFGVVSMDVLERGTTTNRLASFNFGDASGSDPALPQNMAAKWEGIAVGIHKENKNTYQSDATITLRSLTNLSVKFKTFKSLTSDDDPITDTGIWNFLDVENGRFGAGKDHDRGSMSGTFYGDSHGEVGGVFDGKFGEDRDIFIIGAFGAKKE